MQGFILRTSVNRSLFGQAVRHGLHADEVWCEVWSGFAGRKPFDPTRGTNIVHWVQCRATNTLRNLNEKLRNKSRRDSVVGVQDEEAHRSPGPVPDLEGDVLDLLDLADALDVQQSTIAAIGLGWKPDEIADGLGLTMDELRDRLLALVESRRECAS